MNNRLACLIKTVFSTDKITKCDTKNAVSDITLLNNIDPGVTLLDMIQTDQFK